MERRVVLVEKAADALEKAIEKLPRLKKAKKIGVDSPAPDPDGIDAPLEKMVDGAEDGQAAGEWLSMALAGADKAGKALGMAGVTGGAAAVAGGLEKATPVVQGALTAVDVARMSLSPEYREAVKEEGSKDARTDRGIGGEMLNQAGYVMSRPAATGSHFFSQMGQLDTDRANQELKTASTERQTRAQDEANRQQVASNQLDDRTNENRQRDMDEMRRALDPDFDIEARTMGLVKNIVRPETFSPTKPR
jgi:hypothetical protein